jgi:SAM-dependent methyltransferase
MAIGLNCRYNPAMNVTEFNRFAWDRQAERGNEWTRPVSSSEVALAKAGQWKIILTPTKYVPNDWLPPLRGVDVLCLASGGGQQGPILAAAGANVTVFDNSERQLEQDRAVADRENLSIYTVQGDMADLGVFRDEVFDVIVHPVSNVFVPDVNPVWKECFRVLRKGGVLLAGFNNPVVHLIDYDHFARTGQIEVKHKLPYSDLESLSPEAKKRYESEGIPLEFGHTLEDQIGGQISAGFSITGFYEDRDRENSDNPLKGYTAMYVATRALKPV